MRLLFGSLFAFVIAAAIGLGLTWTALTRGTAYGGITIGAWTAWPRNGTLGIDPYARAIVARSGELPIGSGEIESAHRYVAQQRLSVRPPVETRNHHRHAGHRSRRRSGLSRCDLRNTGRNPAGIESKSS